MIKKIALTFLFLALLAACSAAEDETAATPQHSSTPAVTKTAVAETPVAETADDTVSEPETSSATTEGSAESETTESDGATAEVSAEMQADLALFEPPLLFATEQDGFSFRNFSGRYKEGDLTLEETRALFGDAVCRRIRDGECIPHPKVVTWIDDINEEMNDVGHCIGFTVASSQLHQDESTVSALGAETTAALEREVPVLRTISQGYASFYASNVWTQEVRDKTPSEIVEALLLLDEPVDMGIYFPEYGRNGHSVLAHNVVEQGDGIYHILVYDSNRPGEDNIIVVDTISDTWFYAEGATNPDEPTLGYQGDAETKSLTYVPLTAYTEPLACPAEFAELCPANDGGDRFSVVRIIGAGEALVDAASGQIGRLGDALVNTIPGAQLLSVRGELYSRQQPVMMVPSDEPFTLQVQSEVADEDLKISVANPDYSVVVDGLVGQPEQLEQLRFDPISQQAEFVAGGLQLPSFEFVFTQDDEDYQVQLLNVFFEPGATLTAGFDPSSGDLRLDSSGIATEFAVLIVARLTDEEEAIFAASEVVISDEAPQALDLDGWDGVGALTVTRDDDGDGSYEAEVTLENQSIETLLRPLSKPELLMEMFQNLVPYQDDATRQTVAESLPSIGFGGGTLGEAYTVLLPQLDTAGLAEAVSELVLPPAQLGEFIVALNLDETETEQLLDILEVSDEERMAVQTAIEEQKAVNDALADWEFLNLQDGDRLQPFIEEQALNPLQVSEFLARVDLPEEDVSPVRRQYTAPAIVGACSVEGMIPVPITFVNGTNEFVTIHWIDYDCVERPGSLSAPGTAGGGRTWVTHPFVARDLDGNLLPLETPSGLTYTFIASDGGSVVVTIRK